MMTTTEIIPPKNCPECGQKLDVFEDSTEDATEHIYCTNTDCKGRVVGHFCFVGDREVLEIDGLGPELSAKLVTDDYARNVAELVEFADEINDAITKNGEGPVTKSLQKEGFTSAVVKMAKSVQLAKHASWERWIAALGIPMVSDTLGKIIAKEMKLTADDMVNLVSKFRDFLNLTIAGVGPSKKAALQDWLKTPANIDIIQSLAKSGVKPTPLAAPKNVNGPLRDVVFCITGGFPNFGERTDIESKLSSLGATAKSGVSKKTNLLLVGEDAGGTKLNAAKKLGVQQVGEDWLQRVYTEHGLQTCGNKFPI